MKLAIGGPTRDSVPASFAVDVAQLYAYTRERGPWGSQVTVGFLASTYIHVGRELFLEASIKQGATHVLWLDTDMSFPRETAVLLSMHDEAMVGCNYRVRQPSGLFTAQRDDSARIATTASTTGLEAVDAIGFGVVLMRTDLVADLPRPWFRHGLNAQGGDVGEDIMFCRALREAGHTIYLDHDLSKEIGHVGQHEYRTLTPTLAEVAL
jgi:hypothetical protein